MGKNRARNYEWATVECEEGSYVDARLKMTTCAR